jgi:putative tryptophan/tyrosine transport system substrate-binding protein
MRRRDLLIGGVGLAAAFSARTTHAQQPMASARIGWLATGDKVPHHYFDEALRRLGWVEGHNLMITRRVSGHDPQKRIEVARDLVSANPHLIVAAGSTDALPLRSVTQDIPIVVVHGTDLVAAGLVKSLARPQTNVTGLTVIGRELDGKRLELLRELLPNATQVSMLGNSQQLAIYGPRLAGVEALARPLGFNFVRRMAANPEELESAFAAAAVDRDQAILIPFNALTFEGRQTVIALAAQLRVPAMYEFREYVQDGGLISYGAVYRDYFEGSAVLADKILRGASPAELPIQQPTRFELTVNLKTARALGLEIPSALLARADEVIE